MRAAARILADRAFFWASAVILALVLSGIIFYLTEAKPVVEPQKVESQLPPLTAAGSGQRVLVFSPHPDDETIALGGYIYQSEKNGAEVRIVLVTNGNRHHQMGVRYEEFRRATSLLGVSESDLVFLGYPDGHLKSENQTEVKNRLRQELDSFAPQIVLYPTPRDAHPDHAATGTAMEDLLKTEPQDLVKYEYLVHYELLYPQPRKYAPNLNLLPPVELKNLDWSAVALSAQSEIVKRNAIFTYRSQMRDVFLRQLLVSSIRRNELLVVRGSGAPVPGS